MSAEKDRGRIIALDGLRGVAFLLVFMVHLRLPPGSASQGSWIEHAKEFGWIGVPLFFVLSGYLITSLAIAEGRHFSLWRFHARRALRLWPLYFIATCAALWAWQLEPLRMWRIAAAPEWAVPLVTFTLNFALHAHWDSAGTLGALIIFWTLCIEEQFYLSWSLALTLRSRVFAAVLCLGIFVVSWLARFILTDEPYFLFYRMQTLVGFGSIMLGCGLALFGIGPSRWSVRFSNAFSVLIFCAAAVIAYAGWPFPETSVRAALLQGAVDALCVALLALALYGNGALNRILRWQPLRSVGEWSYAGYVFHFATLTFYYAAIRPRVLGGFAADPPALALVVDAAIVLPVTLSLASAWHRLEAPFRRARARLHARSEQAPADTDIVPSAIEPTVDEAPR